MFLRKNCLKPFIRLHIYIYIYIIFFLRFCVGLGSHQYSTRVSNNMSSSSIQVTLNRLCSVTSITSGVYVTSVLDNESGESSLNSDITSVVSVTSVMYLTVKSIVTVQASVPGSVQSYLSKNSFNSGSSSNIVLSSLATPTRPPDKRNAIRVDYKLILCVVVPLFSILVFVIVVAVLLCIRRYRK